MDSSPKSGTPPDQKSATSKSPPSHPSSRGSPKVVSGLARQITSRNSPARLDNAAGGSIGDLNSTESSFAAPTKSLEFRSKSGAAAQNDYAASNISRSPSKTVSGGFRRPLPANATAQSPTSPQATPQTSNSPKGGTPSPVSRSPPGLQRPRGPQFSQSMESVEASQSPQGTISPSVKGTPKDMELNPSSLSAVPSSVTQQAEMSRPPPEKRASSDLLEPLRATNEPTVSPGVPSGAFVTPAVPSDAVSPGRIGIRGTPSRRRALATETVINFFGLEKAAADLLAQPTPLPRVEDPESVVQFIERNLMHDISKRILRLEKAIGRGSSLALPKASESGNEGELHDLKKAHGEEGVHFSPFVKERRSGARAAIRKEIWSLISLCRAPDEGYKASQKIADRLKRLVPEVDPHWIETLCQSVGGARSQLEQIVWIGMTIRRQFGAVGPIDQKVKQLGSALDVPSTSDHVTFLLEKSVEMEAKKNFILANEEMIEKMVQHCREIKQAQAVCVQNFVPSAPSTYTDIAKRLDNLDKATIKLLAEAQELDSRVMKLAERIMLANAVFTSIIIRASQK